MESKPSVSKKALAILGFMFVGTTAKKIACNYEEVNCHVYDHSNGVCTQCSKRYWMTDEHRCIQVNDQCKDWSRTNGDCTCCYEGWVLSNGKCLLPSQVSGEVICNSPVKPPPKEKPNLRDVGEGQSCSQQIGDPQSCSQVEDSESCSQQIGDPQSCSQQIGDSESCSQQIGDPESCSQVEDSESCSQQIGDPESCESGESQSTSCKTQQSKPAKPAKPANPGRSQKGQEKEKEKGKKQDKPKKGSQGKNLSNGTNGRRVGIQKNKKQNNPSNKEQKNLSQRVGNSRGQKPKANVQEKKQNIQQSWTKPKLVKEKEPQHIDTFKKRVGQVKDLSKHQKQIGEKSKIQNPSYKVKEGKRQFQKVDAKVPKKSEEPKKFQYNNNKKMAVQSDKKSEDNKIRGDRQAPIHQNKEKPLLGQVDTKIGGQGFNGFEGKKTFNKLDQQQKPKLEKQKNSKGIFGARQQLKDKEEPVINKYEVPKQPKTIEQPIINLKPVVTQQKVVQDPTPKIQDKNQNSAHFGGKKFGGKDAGQTLITPTEDSKKMPTDNQKIRGKQ